MSFVWSSFKIVNSILQHEFAQNYRKYLNLLFAKSPARLGDISLTLVHPPFLQDVPILTSSPSSSRKRDAKKWTLICSSSEWMMQVRTNPQCLRININSQRDRRCQDAAVVTFCLCCIFCQLQLGQGLLQRIRDFMLQSHHGLVSAGTETRQL